MPRAVLRAGRQVDTAPAGATATEAH